MPTPLDAELVLKLYDLRREAVMREHRKLFIREFWPRTADEVVAVTRPDHPLNVAYRQVTTYWEMAYSFCRHGVLSAELLLDSSMEGLYIYARIEPYLTELRAATHGSRTLRSTEWIATQTAPGREVTGIQRARVRRLLELSG
jgi:hypothetical protein